MSTTIDSPLYLLDFSDSPFTVKQRFDGGMGTCYCIQDVSSSLHALKIIHHDLLMDEHAVSRYIQEIKMWISFSSCEGIVNAESVTQINRIPAVISTWMSGGQLSSIMKSHDLSLFYHSMDRIITSLKWVYDHYNVIHRDLKPGNILLDEHNKPFISDWGLGKFICHNDLLNKSNAVKFSNNDSNPTDTKGFIGTVVYASPEQLLGLPSIDHRSDIYSLGCIMYEWETGHPPFLGKTIQEIASAHLSSNPHRIDGLFTKTNLKAGSIIMRCLEKKPEQRYQSYDELLDDLRKTAKRKCESFIPTVLHDRHSPVYIGHNEFSSRQKQGKLGIKGSKNYYIIEQSDVKPYINEAINLISLGEYDKAIRILESLYIKDKFERVPDYEYHQLIAINLAHAYNSIYRPQKAIEVLSSIKAAKHLEAAYYVNLSFSYIILSNYEKACEIGTLGIRLYHNDVDILGNLAISHAYLGKFDSACEYASRRMSIQKSVAAFTDMGLVFYLNAESLKNTNFPKAIALYKQSLQMYRSALSYNPKDPVALSYVSLLLFKMKRYEDANKFNSHIAETEKRISEINAFYTARNMFYLGNYEDAINYCDEQLKHYPQSVMLNRIKSQCLVDGLVINPSQEDGKHFIEQTSWDFFEHIVDDEAKRVASDFVYLARLYRWVNRKDTIDGCYNILRWGKKFYPSQWEYNYYLAYYYSIDGNQEKALAEAQECQRIAPWREESYTALANIYEDLGNKSLASKYNMELERIKEEKERLYKSCDTL